MTPPNSQLKYQSNKKWSSQKRILRIPTGEDLKLVTDPHILDLEKRKQEIMKQMQ